MRRKDKSLIACTLLGTASGTDDVDTYADFDASTELCEQCAESGYLVLQKKYNDAGCDEELFERRLMRELEMLYLRNVSADI